MPSFVLTAYAGTGKDTFFTEVANCMLRWEFGRAPAAPAGARWVAYAAPGCNPADLRVLAELRPARAPVANMRGAAPRARRYAFANALKTDTHRQLGFRDCPAHAFEAVKDTLVARDPHSGEVATLRAHYIRLGQEARGRDPLVWARIVAKEIWENRLCDYPGPPVVDITTDWRFENELAPRLSVAPSGSLAWREEQAIAPTTVRLFREEVKAAAPTADRATDSEHNLDGVKTDYLLVPPGQFEAALRAFPQYEGFEPVASARAK